MATKYANQNITRRQHPKTINRVFSARRRIENIAIPNGPSGAPFIIDLGAIIPSTLVGAAYNGDDLPYRLNNRSYGQDGEGIVKAEIVDIYDNDTKKKLSYYDTTLDEEYEIFGRINATVDAFGGIVAISLSFKYKNQLGVETDVRLAASAITIEYSYAHKFEDLPLDFATSITSRNVQQDFEPFKAAVAKEFSETFTLTTSNAIPKLSHTPIKGTVTLNYTGHISSEKAGDFTIVGTVDGSNPVAWTLNNYNAGTPAYGLWNQLTAGFSIEAGEKVTLTYFTYDVVNYGGYIAVVI